ncbi:serine/threonine-protein kinase [Candidatus Uabimicrobium amorphum]|uniref:non-specific serine/threonine protein kinase n=1 Tax=Uabimicrobium amorphum TaxID=2596890 RepID=A0A5S9F1B0_UABAM|nr:serine/threonine-protein kinase [Candidatus Uabimicrobium amorphum]BBM82417.1 protein kinase [Candidatus Uabimicrobium amorphum]
MATPPEILFLKIAINKGYMSKDEANHALLYQKQFAEKGQQIYLVNYLLAKKMITAQQAEEIKREYQNHIAQQKTPNTTNIATPNSPNQRARQRTQANQYLKGLSNTRKLNKVTVQNKTETKRYNKSDFANLSQNSLPKNIAKVENTVSSPVIGTGEMFGHYRIEKEIGQGGMGSVYKVYDTKLNRTVALKVISTEHKIKEKRKKRFLQEIKATAQLNHPNIVQVLEAGETPQNYFTMEYLEGGTLSPLIKNGPLKPVQAAMIVQKIAEALYYAHKNGIIHRDIKPSNIMFNANREPKLMDFGLSKMIDVDDNLSKSGEALGTPAYMSPEQANGNETEPQSDIYSLGATLYEMLTGKQVFEGESYYDILNKVFHEDPILPRELNPDIPKDLQAICLKALQKKSQNRYVNARNFAKDLKNFVERKPVSARPISLWQKISKFSKRYRITILVSTLLFSFFVMGTIGYMYMLYDKHKSHILYLYELQRTEKSLQTNPIFFKQLYIAFTGLETYNQIEKLFTEETRKALILHLWALHHVEMDDKANIKKWILAYDYFIQQNAMHRAYYFCNRGYLNLLRKNNSAAANDFDRALELLQRNKQPNSEEDDYLFEFCNRSKKQVKQESRGE